jgi:hypothetical protein
MGKIYKNDIVNIKQYLSVLSITQKIEIVKNSISKICGYDIPKEHLVIKELSNTKIAEHEILMTVDNIKIILDKSQDKSVFENHFIRMIIYNTQKIRKSLGIRPWDPIVFYYNSKNNDLMQLLKQRTETLKKELSYNITFEQLEFNKWCEQTFTHEYNGNIENINIIIYKS